MGDASYYVTEMQLILLVSMSLYGKQRKQHSDYAMGLHNNVSLRGLLIQSS